MEEKNALHLKNIAFVRLAIYPNRPTIIFLHDSLGCIELWRDFPKQLANIVQCNIFVYDRQGYGKSCPFSYSKRNNDYLEHEADILNELLISWDIENPILFGHSDGGSIALLAAAKYPEKIMGIITEGAHIFVEDSTVKGIKEAIRLYKTSNLKAKLEKYHSDKTDKMFWAWAETWTSDTFKTWNIEHFLPLIKCPSLIIQGENDEYGTLKQVNGIIEKTSGLSLSFVLPNTTHPPHKDTPEWVLEKSAQFINQLIDSKKEHTQQ